ncbi:MAG: RNA helicase domain-containing protein, partial [Candidatus Bathyarchaeota archaeon]|nr:RNA helicase domain-containing protein [Candidatus Bathyarchaeota archaeon]
SRARDGTFKILFGLDTDTLVFLAVLCFILVVPFLSRSQVVLCISLLTLYLTFTSEKISEFTRFVFSQVKSHFGFEVVQNDLSFAMCSKFFITCFAMWNMSVRYGEDASTFDKIHGWAKAFKGQTYKVSDLSEAIGKAQEVLREAIEFTSAIFGLKLDTSLLQGESWFEIEQLNNQFLVLKEQYDKRENVHAVASQLMVLEKQGMTLLNRFKAGGPAYIQYRDAMMRIVLLRDELAKIGCFGNSTRQEPLFVIVAGQAGVGKSTVSNLMQSVMIREVYGPEAVRKFASNDSGSFVYAPNQESKFLDGYNNQGIVLLDDFASSVEACQNWTQQIIHLVNTQPHQTPQASLERKGAVYFDSKFILATSNVTAFSGTLGHMYSKEAVARRMHLCLKVRVKPQFALPCDGGDPKVNPDAIAEYREQNPGVAECFWLDWFTFDPLTGAEKPLCPCGLKCTNIDAYPDACSPATLKDALKLIIKTYRFRRDYEIAQRERNKSLMEFLTTGEDTLDCLENAFTQSSCGLPICFACARNGDARREAVAHAAIIHYEVGPGHTQQESYANFLEAWAAHRERIRNRLRSVDIAKSFFVPMPETPICWLTHLRAYPLVAFGEFRNAVLDYTANVSYWDMCERTAVGSVSHVFRDYFRHVADAPFVEKFIAATTQISLKRGRHIEKEFETG